MPSTKPWETFAKWGDRWGEVSSATVFGHTYIVLNSYRAANALLNKRSGIYSDRPSLAMAGDLMGAKDLIALVPYGDAMKSQRRMFHSHFGSKASVRAYYPMEELEAAKFMKRILDTPEQLSSHIAQSIVTLILRITYGYEVTNEDDEFVKIVQLAMADFGKASMPGSFLVDAIPLLKLLPGWFPGAAFKSLAQKWKKDLYDMIELPYAYVKQTVATGEAKESFVSTLLPRMQAGDITEHDLKWAAGAVFGAGGDTSVATLQAFFILMLLNPDVQKKAQDEIDSVTGGHRLPTYADMEDLPYIDALCKELLRFHPVAPLALPHRCIEDDIFEGHFIPKGSTILANTWKMTRDATVYKNPETFDPMRFMGPNAELDPREFCFGFGRRVCPGRLLAHATMFIVCTMSLSLFDIRPVEGDKPEFVSEHGTISYPRAFQCDISPRISRQRVEELL
ncbi:cytochrome P450, partial [Cylindrobasidium torrendii FP15055 ss-10]